MVGPVHGENLRVGKRGGMCFPNGGRISTLAFDLEAGQIAVGAEMEPLGAIDTKQGDSRAEDPIDNPVVGGEDDSEGHE